MGTKDKEREKDTTSKSFSNLSSRTHTPTAGNEWERSVEHLQGQDSDEGRSGGELSVPSVLQSRAVPGILRLQLG